MSNTLVKVFICIKPITDIICNAQSALVTNFYISGVKYMAHRAAVSSSPEVGPARLLTRHQKLGSPEVGGCGWQGVACSRVQGPWALMDLAIESRRLSKG